MEHTPGPWHVAQMADEIIAHVPGSRLVHVIASRPEYSTGDELWQTNARLIAAAPELLGACKALVALCDRTGYHPTEECKLAQSVIDKAEGRA